MGWGVGGQERAVTEAERVDERWRAATGRRQKHPGTDGRRWWLMLRSSSWLRAGRVVCGDEIEASRGWVY